MVFKHQTKPKPKFLTDLFHLLVEIRKATAKENGVTSGLAEEASEKDQLLDELIIQIDEYEESSRKEKEQRSSTEQTLLIAGEQIRNVALARHKSSSTSDRSGEENFKSVRGTSCKKRKTIAEDGSDMHELHLLKEGKNWRKNSCI